MIEMTRIPEKPKIQIFLFFIDIGEILAYLINDNDFHYQNEYNYQRLKSCPLPEKRNIDCTMTLSAGL